MPVVYAEGSCFAVPLQGDTCATGVVARATRWGGVALLYFFGPRRIAPAQPRQLARLEPAEAIAVWRASDARIGHAWPILGSHPHFVRARWPNPPFASTDLSGRGLRVTYSDTHPLIVAHQEPLAQELAETLDPSHLFDPDAVEATLEALL